MATQTISPSPAFLVFPALSKQHKRLNIVALMPTPQYSERESYLALHLRGACQLWYDYANGHPNFCERPASISDPEIGMSFCPKCWRANQ
jgi:hypothetical protein